MKEKGLENLRTLRNKILTSRDLLPTKIQDGIIVSITSVLHCIQVYVSSSLSFGDEPLKTLCKYFPEITFTYMKPRNREEAAYYVSVADYSIVATDHGDYSLGIITIAVKNWAVRRELCYCSRTQLGPNFTDWEPCYKQLQNIGAGLLISDGDGEDKILTIDEAKNRFPEGSMSRLLYRLSKEI